MEATRVDRWLWSVRVYKSRAMATDACSGGHVKVNGAPAKPANRVRVGDRVEADLRGQRKVLEVVRVVEQRLGAPLAAECYVDHSPPPTPRDDIAAIFAREPGAGRPTKRDRRNLDRFRLR